MSAAHELKDKILQVLLAHSYSLLANNAAAAVTNSSSNGTPPASGGVGLPPVGDQPATPAVGSVSPPSAAAPALDQVCL